MKHFQVILLLLLFSPLIKGQEGATQLFSLQQAIDYAVKKRLQKGVKHRVLSFQPGISLKKLAAFEKQKIREVRYLPETFNSLGYINIFDNKIVNWNTALARAVVIEDPVMANFYKTIFEILWSLCQNKDNTD